MPSFKDILRTSRPLLWLNTSVLWVLALMVLEEPPTWADLLMIFYFTLPFNLWLHGINDIYDFESDLLNERKGSDEGALLARSQHQPLLHRVVIWNLPFWFIAFWQGTPLAISLLALFLFLGWAYSAPPIRGKSRPFLDSLINSAYIMPYLIALAWHNAPPQIWQLSFPAIIAFCTWSIASHTFASIQDIDSDQAGGISTIATFLGAESSAWLALLLYLLALLATSTYGWQWAGGITIYLALVLSYLIQPSRQRAHRLYRTFILLNSTLGFIVTVNLALASPANTLWAALVVLSLVGLVFISRHWSMR